MVVGFNHNFRYKGSLYHVQTEDGGIRNPQIVTLLFSGGTILASRKTSYADIVKVNNLDQVVEELMKEQHREMLRQLKDGQLDALIRERLGQGRPASPEGGRVSGAVRPAPTSSAPAAAAQPRAKTAGAETSLDDIILSYLTGDSGGKP